MYADMCSHFPTRVWLCVYITGFFKVLYIFAICMRLGVCGGAHATVDVWGSEDNLWKSVPSLRHAHQLPEPPRWPCLSFEKEVHHAASWPPVPFLYIYLFLDHVCGCFTRMHVYAPRVWNA